MISSRIISFRFWVILAILTTTLITALYSSQESLSAPLHQQNIDCYEQLTSSQQLAARIKTTQIDNNSNTPLVITICDGVATTTLAAQSLSDNQIEIEGVWSRNLVGDLIVYKLGSNLNTGFINLPFVSLPHFSVDTAPELPPGYMYLTGASFCRESNGGCGRKLPSDIFWLAPDSNAAPYILLRKNLKHLTIDRNTDPFDPENWDWWDVLFGNPVNWQEFTDPLPQNCGEMWYSGVSLFDNDLCKGGYVAYDYEVSFQVPNGFVPRSTYIRDGWSAAIFAGNGYDHVCARGSLWDFDQDYMNPNPGVPLQGNVAGMDIHQDATCGGRDLNQNGILDSFENNNSPTWTPTPTKTPTSDNSPKVALYAQVNYAEPLEYLGVGTHDVPNRNYFSMYIPGGMSAILRRSDNTDRCFATSVHNLQDHEEWWREIDKVEVYAYNACPEDPTPTPNTSGVVRFFAKANYEDEVLSLSPGTHNVPDRTYFSIDMPDGWSVRLYDDSGNNRCFNQDVPNLQDHEEWWRLTRRVDVMTSDNCGVVNGKIRLYHVANFVDQFMELGAGTHNIAYNTQIFSVRVDSGMSTIFHAPDGRHKCWNEDVPNVQDHESYWYETIKIEVFGYDACPKNTATPTVTSTSTPTPPPTPTKTPVPPTHTPTKTRTPPPSPLNTPTFTPTRTPTKTSTPTKTPTPTPTPTPRSLFLPFVSYDLFPPSTLQFDDDFCNQSVWPVNDTPNYALSYIASSPCQYQIWVKSSAHMVWTSPDILAENFMVESVLQSVDNHGASGILFGLSSDNRFFYVADITPNGYYTLARYDNWSREYIIPPTYSSLIRKDAPNLLTVISIKEQLILFLNSVHVETVIDNRSHAGRLGLFTETSPGNFTARYSRFTVWNSDLRSQTRFQEHPNSAGAPLK